MRFLRSTAAIAAVAGALFSHNASAVNIANEGIGEVAIAPFYTTREGWQSTINLINTQDRPVAVKVRFHEALNSRDVLDFTVLLSAFDVFTGVVREGASGNPVFVNIDQANDAGLKTCTVPNTTNAANGGGEGIEIPLSVGGFSGLDFAGANNADGGPETTDRLKEGYIEFIVMGFADQNYGIDPTNSPIDAVDIDSATYAALGTTAAKRNFIGRAIEDHDCPTLRTAFVPTNIVNTARQFGEPISALKFNFTLLNPARGTETGYSATTWSNFYNPGNGSGVVTPAGVLDTLVIPEDNFNCDFDRGIERRTARTGSDVYTGTNWCPDGTSDDTCATGGPAINASDVNADYVVGVDYFADGFASDTAVDDSCRNLITAQFPDDFLEPTLNDTFPQEATFIEDQSGLAVTLAPYAPVYSNFTATVEDIRGVDALSLTIQRATVINDWSTNPALGVSTDWIVTQPTKAFYVDQSSAAQSQVIVSYEDAATDDSNGTTDTDAATGPADPNNGIKGRAEAFLPETGPNTAGAFGATGLVPYPPYAQKFAGVAPNARSCNEVAFAVYDRAEQSGEVAPDEPVFSPSVPEASVPNQLCYEANVISFVDSAGVLQTALGTGLNRLTVDTPNILATPQDFGWMLMQLDNFGAGYFGASMPVTATASVRGLPVIGFNIRTRNFPARPDLSFSSSADHAYLRNFFE